MLKGTLCLTLFIVVDTHDQATELAELQSKYTSLQSENLALLATQAEFEVRLKAMEAGAVYKRPRITSNARRLDDMFSEDGMTKTKMGLSAVTDVAVKEMLTDLVDALATKFVDYTTCLDYMWLLIAGVLVMFMQAGFAILEAGACRAKNAGTLMMKNVIDCCVGTIIWYFFGYGIAYGLSDAPNEFTGTHNFFGLGFMEYEDGALTGTVHLRDWFFQWAFCATAATIVSGGVAERIQLSAYFIYSIVMTGVIYPFIVYWTWSGEGFLTRMGYSDFAGSGIVHLTGGIGALCGAIFCGERHGRWTSEAGRFDPHNMGLVVLGTFILWFGWYGFNCGSTLSFSDSGTAHTASLIAMNSTLAAASGGLTVFLARYVVQRHFDLAGTCNGILAGLVAICAGCDVYSPAAAMVVGILGGCAHEGGHYFTQMLKIDDPLDAFAVHGCGGITGMLLRPLLPYTGPDGKMFGAHVVALFTISAWCFGISSIVFASMRVCGKLRLSEEEQLAGTDAAELGSRMYRIGSGTPAMTGNAADSFKLPIAEKIPCVETEVTM